MPSGGFWGGVGEPTIAVAAPAAHNAIFAAIGRRISQVPLKHADLRSCLSPIGWRFGRRIHSATKLEPSGLSALRDDSCR